MDPHSGKQTTPVYSPALTPPGAAARLPAVVLSYFANPITNAASEAINSTIQMIKKRAFGFRSFVNFRVAVLFRCGDLDLYPRFASHPNA